MYLLDRYSANNSSITNCYSFSSAPRYFGERFPLYTSRTKKREQVFTSRGPCIQKAGKGKKILVTSLASSSIIRETDASFRSSSSRITCACWPCDGFLKKTSMICERRTVCVLLATDSEDARTFWVAVRRAAITCAVKASMMACVCVLEGRYHRCMSTSALLARELYTDQSLFI